MFCKRLYSLLLGMCFCLFGAAQAHGQVNIVLSGKDKGEVSSMEVNGVTYVDAQRTARKLGADVELFAASKQIKISAKGFYAVLTAPLEDIILNAQPHKLNAPVISSGGKILCPTEFFLLPSFQKAVDKYISFADHTFVAEKRFTLAFEEKQLSAEENLLIFSADDTVNYQTKNPNAHTVVVVFEGAVLKRNVSERLHTDFISSMGILQTRENAELKVILGPNARHWTFTNQDGKLVFRAGAKAQSPALLTKPKEEPIPAVDLSAPVIKADNPQPKEAFLYEGSPSVLAEQEDEFTEMPATEQEAATIDLTAAQAVPVPAPQPQKPSTAPVIKAEPHPLSISEVHQKIRVVVDAGHGGKDAGAVRGRYREKDWNLGVSKELVKLLKKGGFDVKTTRETDTFVALGDRAKISNKFKADLFVSIHTNASKDTRANGFQVYFRSDKATDKEAAETAELENEAMQYEEAHYGFVDALLQSLAKNEFMNESSKLSGYVQKEVYKQQGIGIAVNQKTGLRQANFYVLRGVNAPSILVEMGFISSSKDRGRLSQASVQKKMAQGIYNGIVAYTKAELKKK